MFFCFPHVSSSCVVAQILKHSILAKMHHQADAPPKPRALQTESNYMHENQVAVCSNCSLPLKNALNRFVHFKSCLSILQLSNCVVCSQLVLQHMDQSNTTFHFVSFLFGWTPSSWLNHKCWTPFHKTVAAPKQGPHWLNLQQTESFWIVLTFRKKQPFSYGKTTCVWIWAKKRSTWTTPPTPPAPPLFHVTEKPNNLIKKFVTTVAR